LPKGWYFSGPLFAYLRNDIPPDIQKILDQTDRKKLYFSMGSSANRSVLLRALEALEAFDGWVIAPIRAHLTLEDKIPSNVIVCDWLPALQVNEKVDAALIHGGQGTVQTAVMAGVPFVGIGMQPEQDMNIYLYVQFGNALQLKKKNFTKQHVLESLNLILTEDTYRKKAQEASLILKNTDTIAIIKSVVLSTLKEIKK
jgi:UDP:flavonoid glycosyltransferase YjiC (YdhE family)